VRGPLHGIPLLLKDNIETAAPVPTTAGSLALEAYCAPRDATVAARLRDAGAVLLGKTNLSEWANFRSLRSTSGWSALGGQCRNPYDLERSPGGSSAGSGVAVAAGLCAAAIGTETDGSIVVPAALNGIVGLKPTVGLVSRAGLVPIAPSQDTAGPMTRCVADAALLLTALAGSDPRDPAPRASDAHAAALAPGAPGPAFAPGAPTTAERASAAPAADDLGGLRVGVVRSTSALEPAEARAFERALDALRRAGATLVDGVSLAGSNELMPHEIQVLLYEFKASIDAYLDALGDGAAVRSLAELIEFNQRHAAREMPHFGQEIFLAAVDKGPLTSPEYVEARAACLRLARDEGIDATLRAHGCAALVAPTIGVAGRIDYARGDEFRGANSSPAAVAGYPSLAVPAGLVGGLPFGVLFFAGPFSEATLLRLGVAFERAVGRLPPP